MSIEYPGQVYSCACSHHASITYNYYSNEEERSLNCQWMNRYCSNPNCSLSFSSINYNFFKYWSTFSITSSQRYNWILRNTHRHARHTLVFVYIFVFHVLFVLVSNSHHCSCCGCSRPNCDCTELYNWPTDGQSWSKRWSHNVDACNEHVGIPN